MAEEEMDTNSNSATAGINDDATAKQPAVVHECFTVLSGRGKGTIGSNLDLIKLVGDVLKLDISEYVPPHLTYDHFY